MLKWPERARRSVAKFFVKWNDFDVYVEDTAKHANSIYTVFISRVASGNCKVDKVIPLGDRKKVIDAAESDSGSGGRRRIYLIDGDLDLIAGINPPTHSRLFAHRVYHLENYFLCEEALVQILHEENPKLTAAEVRSKLEYANWETDAKALLNLFRTFGLTRLLDPSLPTISIGIGHFSTNNKTDEAKIQAFCALRIKDLESRFPKQDIDAAIGQVNTALTKVQTHTDLISAREFLLPTLRWWINGHGLKLPSSTESLLFRLSKMCSVKRHACLIDAIRACATR